MKIKTLGRLFLSTFVVIVFGLLLLGSCSLFASNKQATPTYEVNYNAEGEPDRYGYVSYGGDKTVKKGAAFSFYVNLYNGYLPDELIVVCNTKTRVEPSSIRFSDGSAFSADQAAEKFSRGGHIVCSYTVEDVSESPNIHVVTKYLKRATVTVTVTDEDNHARGYRIAKEFEFEKDNDYTVFYKMENFCEKSAFFVSGEEKKFEVPFGCRYFLICDGTIPEVLYEDDFSEDPVYLDYACDRWIAYTEMSDWFFQGLPPKYGAKITVLKTNYTFAEQNDQVLLNCASEEGTSVLFPKETDDSSMTIYLRGEGGNYEEPTFHEWRPVYDVDGVFHWYERAIFEGDMYLKLPSYADAFDYYLSDKPDSDENVVSIARTELNGEKCLFIRESDVPRKAAFLRKKLKDAYSNAAYRAGETTVYYLPFRSACSLEQQYLTDEILGMNPIFYPKGSSAENTVFVFDDGYFYQYICKRDLEAAENVVVLEYTAAPEGEPRFSRLKFNYIRKLYSKEYYEDVSGYSDKSISPIVLDGRSYLELPTTGTSSEAYIVSFHGRAEEYTTELYPIDLENSDLGGATAKITNYDKETNSTLLPGLRGEAAEWGDAAFIGVNKTLYLNVFGAEKKIEYLELYSGEEEVPFECLPLTDIAGRPLFLDSSAFILRLSKGYYSYSDPIRIRIVYEEEEGDSEEN